MRIFNRMGGEIFEEVGDVFKISARHGGLRWLKID
jgi:hypothetical protein